MTIFEKARELGEMLNESEQAQLRDQQEQLFLQDDSAREKMKEYEDYHNEVQQAMQTGELTKEEFQLATTKLKRLGMELKIHPVAGPYIEAVNQFNETVNQVFQIIQRTVLGEPEGGCGCGGNCGCGGEGDCDCEGEECGCGGEGEGCGCAH